MSHDYVMQLGQSCLPVDVFGDLMSDGDGQP